MIWAYATKQCNQRKFKFLFWLVYQKVRDYHIPYENKINKIINIWETVKEVKPDSSHDIFMELFFKTKPARCFMHKRPSKPNMTIATRRIQSEKQFRLLSHSTSKITYIDFPTMQY